MRPTIASRARAVVSLAALASFATQAVTAQDLDKLRAKAFERYAKEIDSRDAERRREAAASLGSFDEFPEAVTLLARALGDPEAPVREAAASSLWELGEAASSAEPQLRRALGDPSPAVRVKAAGALEAAGVEPSELVAARRSVLDQGDWFDVALAVRDLIGSVDEGELVLPLLASLRATPPSTDDERFDGAEVLVPLAERGNRVVIGPLMAALSEPVMPRVELLEALGSFDPEPDGWLEALVAAARHPDPEVRATAAEQLGRRARRPGGGAGWPERTLPLLDDADGDVRWEAVRAMGQAGGDASAAVPGLVRILASPGDPGLREAAAESLGEIGAAAEPYDREVKVEVARLAAPPLLRVAESRAEEEDLREEALESYIGLALDPVEAAGVLAVVAERSDLEQLRIYATRALGDLGRGAESALPALERLRDDPEPLVSSAADYSIQQIRSGVSTARAAAPPPGPRTSAPPQDGAREAMGRLRAAGHGFDQDGFYRALLARDTAAVEDYLAAGMSPRDPGTTGIPPLHSAVMFGCDYGQPTDSAVQSMVAALLARGADPNALDEQGNPALHRATSCDAAMVRRLLAAGADMALPNATGTSSFASFVVINPAAAEALLEAGFRFSPQEAEQYREWIASEADPVKRRLLERAR
jgi:HEAT repeat protein